MTEPDDTAGDGVKRYSAGTHRVVDPAATLARVLPLAPRMGITRVAVLTGLDVLGIPVVAATRPNSRSIAVHQGKGVTLDGGEGVGGDGGGGNLSRRNDVVAVAAGGAR